MQEKDIQQSGHYHTPEPPLSQLYSGAGPIQTLLQESPSSWSQLSTPGNFPTYSSSTVQTGGDTMPALVASGQLNGQEPLDSPYSARPVHPLGKHAPGQEALCLQQPQRHVLPFQCKDVSSVISSQFESNHISPREGFIWDRAVNSYEAGNPCPTFQKLTCNLLPLEQYPDHIGELV
jgi:hypothetical protein